MVRRRLGPVTHRGNGNRPRRYSWIRLGLDFTSSGNSIARSLPAVSGEFPVQQGTFYSPGVDSRLKSWPERHLHPLAGSTRLHSKCPPAVQSLWATHRELCYGVRTFRGLVYAPSAK